MKRTQLGFALYLVTALPGCADNGNGQNDGAQTPEQACSALTAGTPCSEAVDELTTDVAALQAQAHQKYLDAEVVAAVNAGGVLGANISFENGGTSMSAGTMQAAITELLDRIEVLEARSRLVWKDANGLRADGVFPYTGGSAVGAVFVDTNGHIWPINPRTLALLTGPNENLYYQSSDCTGAVYYMSGGPVPRFAAFTGAGYYAVSDTATAQQFSDACSVLDTSGSCQPISGCTQSPRTAYAGSDIQSLSIPTITATPPLHLEVE